ncbi:MAG: type VI secretion system baseplate subunit TssF [Alphaproteobacteria bacterium]|nr:type VI secretion system baseplate subunit TssF [Alphaproteobacteria bacterium]
MANSSRDQLLYHYNRELDYLRHAGKQFARQYPKIARRLELSDSESPDPHVERLLESFAFLSGRISKEIEDQHPQTASALLGILYPHIVNPVPAMGIAHLKADPSRGNLTTGFVVPKGTRLNASSTEGIDCTFSTVYPLKLWPVYVDQAKIVPSNKFTYTNSINPIQSEWAIHIKLKSKAVNFHDMKMDHVAFHIAAERKLALFLYQLIFSQPDAQAFISVDGTNLTALPKNTIQPMGFNAEEMSLPMGDHALHTYQMMQEYFHFQEKFLFFKINDIAKAGEQLDLRADTLDLYLPISDPGAIFDIDLKPEHFVLGATPIVNLFKKSTDPFRLDRKQTEYRLVPDQRLDKTLEIYAITKITGSVENRSDPLDLAPYYSLDHAHILNPETVYWVSKRKSAISRGLPGSDMYVSFVDNTFNPQAPAQQIIYAETLCTNRYLAEQIPYNAVLTPEETLPVSQILCITKPVSQIHAPEDGETLWKLISQLSVNHIGLTSGSASVAGLLEMLRLYLRGSRQSHFEIETIKNLLVQTIVRRVNNEAWRGFVRGHEVTLVMDDVAQSGGSTFLLASILRHYFGLHVGINSFVEVVLKNDNQQKEVMRWKPLPGTQITL